MALDSDTSGSVAGRQAATGHHAEGVRFKARQQEAGGRTQENVTLKA
jgi:hypothetical protein